NRLLGLWWRGSAAAADDLRHVRRVHRVDRRPRLQRSIVNDGRIAPSQLLADVIECLQQRSPRIVAAEVRYRLAAECLAWSLPIVVLACGQWTAGHGPFQRIHKQLLLGHMLREAGPQE